MNVSWAEKFISSPISTVLKKHFTQKFQNRASHKVLKNNNKNQKQKYTIK